MHVLVLCNDEWHPAATVRAGLAPLAGPDLQFDFIEHAGDWSVEQLHDYPVVIVTKANKLSHNELAPWMLPEIENAFVNYVSRGGGLLVIHSGSAGYQETPRFRALIGGVFVRHPAQCLVSFEPQARHPLTQGVEAFTLQDEHYEMALDDPNADVFAYTQSEHGRQPGAWTRREGVGRVCMLTPGHNLPIWLHPAYQRMIRNALTWCANDSAES